jgi:uncharacterized protein YggE
MEMLRYASFALVTLAALSGCRPADGPGKFHANVLSVQGEGDFQAKPDIARITLGVESQDANAANAVQTTNAKIAAVIAAVKQSGVADADVQTAQLSIYAEQVTPPYPPPVPAPAPVAATKAAPMTAPAPSPVAPIPQTFYRATNTVVVTVRRIETAGVVIGAALAAGANQAGGIQFDVENHQPLEDQARGKAVADAVHRAQELARLSGVKLGRVLSIAEGPAGDDGPVPMFAAKVASYRADSGAVPVEGGMIKVTHTVRVVFALSAPSPGGA